MWSQNTVPHRENGMNEGKDRKYQERDRAIDLLLSGELPAEDARELRAHLLTCGRCRRAYRDLVAVHAALWERSVSTASFLDRVFASSRS